MRRLAQHAIVGVGFSALVATVAVAGLGSPSGETSAIAVPAPVSAISAPASAAAVDQLAAERAAAKARANRAVARAQLVAAKQAMKRAKSLGLETKAIAEQQAKIKAELAAAAKKAAEEKAALERAIKNRGYEPGVTDPKEIARQILKNKYGYGSGQFRLLQQHHHAREQVGAERDKSKLWRVRHPAGSAWLEDGDDRQRLADQPGDPDHLGYRVHEGSLRQSLCSVGLQVIPRLVLRRQRLRQNLSTTSRCRDSDNSPDAEPLDGPASHSENVQSRIELLFGQRAVGDVPVLDHDLADGLFLFECLLGHGSGILVADVAIQRRDD